MSPLIRDYWCPKCGMVRRDLLAPICRHGVVDSHVPVRVMDELPAWHPLATRDVP